MIIKVAGFDPSLRNWGIAQAELDLVTGVLSTPVLSVIASEPNNQKQVRTNSQDLAVCTDLASQVIKVGATTKVIFVEMPVGSQSAASMKGYGACIGILGALQASGIKIIEVTPMESKKLFTGNKNATKKEMIAKAIEHYPEANWPTYKKKGQVLYAESEAEHMADAIAAIHAGVQTPLFTNLMQLLKEV